MAYYYHVQRLCAIAAVVLLHYTVSAQAGCPNADFSQANFTNWQGYYGNYNNPGQTTGFVAGRHTVITTQAVDPFSCGGLNMIPPGETTSCRLGNSGTGSQAERLRYQLTVGTDNALFVYKYAVVLENPDGHLPNEQPEFSVRILNQSGQQIGGSCGIYTVYGGQPGQNFQTCGGVTWLPWTIVGMDLSPFMGQNVMVEFTTKDCSLSGHFGYAYVSAECMPLLLDVEYCIGSNNVTITAPPGFQDYLWTPGNMTTESIVIQNPVVGSVYNCTLTTFSNQGNCTVALNAQVVPTDVHAEFSSSPACTNIPIQFTDESTVDNGTIDGWEWNFDDGSPPVTTQNPQHTFTTSGTYNVQLVTSSEEGCNDTIVHTLEIYPLPSVGFGFDNECVNTQVDFTNQSVDPLPMDFSWNFGDNSPEVTTQDAAHTYTTDGQYTVTLVVENSNGCVDSLQQNITIYPLPVIDAGPDVQVCPNTQVTLSGSGGVSYTWDNNGVDGVPFIPVASNTYTVTGTDANGCQSTDAMDLTFYPPPVVDAGPDVEVCVGTSVTFTASGADNYVWDGGITDGQSFIPAVGNYTFTVTGTDANGCEDTDQADLIVHPNPVVNAGPDQLICIGATTFVSGSGAATYQWDNGVVNNQIFTPPATTTYTVIGTSAEGCTGTDQVIVAHEPPSNPSFTAPVTSGCEPLTVNLSNTSTGTASADCVWNFGDGQTASGCGTVNHQYMLPGCYDVELILTTALGCEWSVNIPDYICVYPNPVAAFTPVPGTVTEINPASTMSNSSTGAVTYQWNFGDGSALSNEENPEHDFPTYPIQNYLVELTAISEHGCIDTTAHLVIMNEVLIYYVPNAFTPDDDEFNQTFKPVFTSGFDPFDFNMTIFNRWGEIVFETKNHEVGWDGTYNGVIAMDGVYTWRIEVKTKPTDERMIVTGHTSLLR